MSFDLINVSATFQAYINKSLAGLLDNFCVVYLDNILIFFETEIEHLKHVQKVLDRLRQFKLYVNLKKCEFFTQQVNFLKFIVTIKGVIMNKSRINTVKS